MKKISVNRITYIGLFTVIIFICSVTAIPATVPFTLQTFGIFLALGLLGATDGTYSILIYILLGAVGMPVFSGFRGGLGILFGSTGGYILGFLLAALLFKLITHILGTTFKGLAIGMVCGLTVCYISGTLWFMAVSLKDGGTASFFSVMATCVFPFVFPDLIKIYLALIFTKRLKPYLHLK